MNLVFLCLKVFFARIMDVSFGTFRTVTLVKGKTRLAAVIGFFEVLVWFLVVREALNTNEDSILIAISYSLGFSVGTLLGGYISNTFVSGTISIQVITNKISDKMIKKIRDSGYALSIMDLEGNDNLKKMLFIVVNKKELKNIEKIIKEFDNKAFIVANESTYVVNGYFKNDNKK